MKNSSLATTGKSTFGGPLQPNCQSYLAGAEKLHSQGLSFIWPDSELIQWEGRCPQGTLKNSQQLRKVPAAWGNATRWGYREAKKLQRKNWNWDVHWGFKKLQNIPGNPEGQEYMQAVHYVCARLCTYVQETPEQALTTLLWLILRFCTRRK